jgi:WD40 repeat protein
MNHTISLGAIAFYTLFSALSAQGQPPAASAGPDKGPRYDTSRDFKMPEIVKTIACSADGRLIAAAAASKTVTVLDAKTGKTIATLKPEGGDLEALAMSPDGSVVAAGTNHGQIRLFDVKRGALLNALTMSAVRALAFSPDGKLLAACANGGDVSAQAKLWDAKTAALKFELQGHSHANALAFSPDGKTLAIAGRWMKIGQIETGAILWSTETGEKLRTVPVASTRAADAVAFSPDGKHIAVSAPVNGEGGVITLARVESGNPLWSKTIPQIAKPLAFLPNDSAIVTLCNGRMWYFDVHRGEPLMILNPGDKDGKDGRWNDFASTKKNHMQVMGGEGKDGKGSIYVLDPDNRDPVPPPVTKQGL